MNTKPIIGITASLTIDTGKMPGRRIISLSENYVKSISESGGIPIILAIDNNIDTIKEYANLIDGLILSGGYDVNPLLYGEEPNTNLGEIMPERDLFDISLIKEVEKLNKPILGICRGHQILNVSHGGTLYQDLSLIDGSSIKHVQDSFEYEGTHTINIKNNTKLREIFGDSILVNSFHHQAISKVGNNLKVSAISKDGVIEGIENTEGSLKLGIQWHPEMMFFKDINTSLLFKYFISECIKYKK